MNFDAKAFNKAEFEDRTADVPVPELADFFAEGADPIFRVRALTGEEVAKTRDAAEKNRNVAKMMENLMSSQSTEWIEGVRQKLGVTETVTDDYARRLETLSFGLADPKLDHEAVVKLAENYSITFYNLTNKIFELTGLGRQPQKKKNSKAEKKSKQPSGSDTPKGDSSSS